MLLKTAKENIYNKFNKAEFKLEHVAFFTIILSGASGTDSSNESTRSCLNLD